MLAIEDNIGHYKVVTNDGHGCDDTNLMKRLPPPIITPQTLTIITTYQCTAACKECCFECSPQIKHRLSIEEIKQTIEKAQIQYPDIKIVVFTGGECFMLKADLFEAIQYCSEKGLQSRCVTNAYWAKRDKKAKHYAIKLREAGITEINISTGLDHQKWVNKNTIINAVKHLVEQDIFTLVTVEKDSDSSSCFDEILSNPIIKTLIKNQKKLFSLQSNAWMPFYDNSEQRGTTDRKIIDNGCDQIFANIVITPKREVSACCGLTLEHIPEMKLGDISDLTCYQQMQQDDFLKIWIKVEGPLKIIEQLLGREHKKIFNIQHQCQACAILHKDQEVIEKLVSNYAQYIPSVLHKFYLNSNKGMLE